MEIYKERIVKLETDFWSIRVWVEENSKTRMDTLIYHYEIIDNIHSCSDVASYIIKMEGVNAVEVYNKAKYLNTEGVVYYKDWP